MHLFSLIFRYKFSVLLLTYLAYMCYHMTRKPISVVKSVLHRNCSLVEMPNKMKLIADASNESTWCDYPPFGECFMHFLLNLFLGHLLNCCKQLYKYLKLHICFCFCAVTDKNSATLVFILFSSFFIRIIISCTHVRTNLLYANIIFNYVQSTIKLYFRFHIFINIK